MKRLAALLSLIVCITVHAQYSPQRFPVIPKPQTLLPLGGEFAMSNAVTLVLDNKSLKKECEQFRAQAKQLHGLDLRYGKLSGFEPCIFVVADSFGLPPEGYELFVNSEGINLYGTRAGIFYGLQTILQLIQHGTNANSLIVPSCSIIDYPRFSWRGMHLDVARHFFPKENVKDYIRYMAMYKMNTFHWHLTDDQGWRIEIKKYPLLTGVGGWRKHTLVGHYSEEPDVYDEKQHGGFYTQAEISEIIRFADSLHITIVPEIEMPGHASAMLTAYPYLGNTNGPYQVQGTWGVFTEVLAPKDSTFEFLQNVLTEVAALFPGKYIHIGGDECPKDEWSASPFCQNLIRTNNLKDEQGLQSWFVHRIVAFLATKGKNAIGWDEILEGGLPAGAAVMSWRGEDGGIAAARSAHNVVMTPGGYCYIDHYQSRNAGEPLAIGGYLPIEKVYSYDPVPAILNASERKYIMGVQGNLWTEYIPTFSQVQYMLFPRIAALAEVAWSNKQNSNYENFVPRITAHMLYYDKMQVNYSRAMFEINSRYESAGESGMFVHLSTLSSSGEIHFARHGNIPDADGEKYIAPIFLLHADTLTAAVYRSGERISPYFSQTFAANRALGKPVTLRKGPSPSYNTGGAMTLVDGIKGRTPWTGAEWLGWWGDTLDATIDLGKVDTVKSVRLVTLQDQGSWIYYPQEVNVFLSEDGVNFTSASTELNQTNTPENRAYFWYIKAKKARYVRVVAYGKGMIPPGKSGAGYPAWLFASEIIIQ